jgi:3-deoxy-D-arabino-heptulosonate 7-phosphate (DAHP) synthase class II
MLLVDMPEENRLDMTRFRIPRTREEVLGLIERLQQDGATTAMVHLPMGTADLTECLEWVEWFAKEIIPAFRGSAGT